MNTNYLSVKEVALLLGRSEKWVYLHQSEIPGYFNLAGSIFFDREVLQQALKKLATQPKTASKVEDSRSNRHGLS
jgi:predicted DNA-binding transcriptional regulator AlpA